MSNNSLKAVLASSLKYQEKEYKSKLLKVMEKKGDNKNLYISILKQQPKLRNSFKGDLCEAIKIPTYSEMSSEEWIKRKGNLSVSLAAIILTNL